MNKYSLFFGLFFFAAVASAAVIGGWQPIKNVNDPKVVEIGKFAVDEHNKMSKTHLKLVKVVKGEQQLVSGMNYQLTLVVKEGQHDKKYRAVVWEKSGGKTKILKSFAPLKE